MFSLQNKPIFHAYEFCMYRLVCMNIVWLQSRTVHTKLYTLPSGKVWGRKYADNMVRCELLMFFEFVGLKK